MRGLRMAKTKGDVKACLKGPPRVRYSTEARHLQPSGTYPLRGGQQPIIISAHPRVWIVPDSSAPLSLPLQPMPRKHERIAIDLFSGSGGLTQGLKDG